MFANMITEFVNAYEPLKDYLKAYQEPNGQKIYDESLAASREYYPQYVIEMEGMADGSGVPFHKVMIKSYILRVHTRSTPRIVAGRAIVLYPRTEEPGGFLIGADEKLLHYHFTSNAASDRNSTSILLALTATYV